MQEFGELEQWLSQLRARWVNDVILALLPMIGTQEAQAIRSILGTGTSAPTPPPPLPEAGAWRVNIRPPISGQPPAGGRPYGAAYGTIDQAVGSPKVAQPNQAVYVSPYPLVLLREDKPTEIPGQGNGGALGEPYKADQVQTVTITGRIDPSASPQVLYVTTDGGDNWGSLFGGQPWPAGSEFTASTTIAPGDQFNFAPAQDTLFSRLLVTTQTGIPELAAQGTFGGTVSAIPGVAPYPVQFVPVSSFPQLIIKAEAGTNATPGTPIGSTFTAPAPGTIGVFGFIQSGAAYFTLAIETVGGQLQFGGLNGASNQVQGAWVAATVEVDQADTVALSVSSACTLGTVRVTYTPST
jgi:hypothetical protein